MFIGATERPERLCRSVPYNGSHQRRAQISYNGSNQRRARILASALLICAIRCSARQRKYVVQLCVPSPIRSGAFTKPNRSNQRRARIFASALLINKSDQALSPNCLGSADSQIRSGAFRSGAFPKPNLCARSAFTNPSEVKKSSARLLAKEAVLGCSRNLDEFFTLVANEMMGVIYRTNMDTQDIQFNCLETMT
ncbi:hypothetical protein NDU88_003526 [Pleurodeles waltl]|uniref:Uncharacterized protein n=1 Tax=Pleurodeles waltl TaxID=8319 RepID=A0AAV7V2N6_PLEWA|nr:hypothetical protein NDU88_003526 [Pleurodeles waltl]